MADDETSTGRQSAGFAILGARAAPKRQEAVAARVETFVELGPGKVLAGLLRRIHKPAKVLNVGDPEGLEATVAALSA